MNVKKNKLSGPLNEHQHSRAIVFQFCANSLIRKSSSDTGQVRRLLSLAEIYDGGKRTKAARGSRPTAPRDQRT